MPAGKLCQTTRADLCPCEPSTRLQAGASKVFSRPAKRQPATRPAKSSTRSRTSRPAPSPSRARRHATPEGVASLLATVKKTRRTWICCSPTRARRGARRSNSHPDGALRQGLDLNVKAVFATIRDFAPLLQVRASRDDPSRVIITGRQQGRRHPPRPQPSRSSSAAAASRSTRSAPGFFPSKMSNGPLDMAGGPEVVGKGNPMGRLGRPEDIAGACRLSVRAALGRTSMARRLPSTAARCGPRGELNVKL
ncbi:rhamnolipids biosynthesis 3-oxoacyl-reductase [Verticillium dahliae]|nr:rhamnolipids biosynthesis 3-oxoacyl-reductase [Verticillium dahliae]